MSKENPKSKEHYSYITRSLIRLYNEGLLTNVESIDVEPEYGYTSRIKYLDGNYRVTYGNDLGLNPAASCELAKDKGHTKFLLRIMGVNYPEGREFLLPWWAEEIGEQQRQRGNSRIITTDHAAVYIEDKIGYPVYMKPVSGSKGSGVYRVDGPAELDEIIDEYSQKRVRVAVVEEAIEMPDYRIVTLDGELISAYQRKPLAVTGNGVQSVSDLIDKAQAKYIAEGRDTKINKFDYRIEKQLGLIGLSLNDVIDKGITVAVAPVSNLSMGGTSEDVTTTLNPRWAQLAADIAHNFNLRLCGLDLACEDVTQESSDYSVLEVNSCPGLDHFASSGQAQSKIVDELYTCVINAFPNVQGD